MELKITTNDIPTKEMIINLIVDMSTMIDVVETSKRKSIRGCWSVITKYYHMCLNKEDYNIGFIECNGLF